MGLRIFTDSRGTEWKAWDVIPRLGERRMSDRRSRAPMTMHSDRRSNTDRRMLDGQRAPVLTSVLNGGWLCFEAEEGKRRLTPIPSDWLRCAKERLEQYCASAIRVRRPSTSFPESSS